MGIADSILNRPSQSRSDSSSSPSEAPRRPDGPKTAKALQSLETARQREAAQAAQVTARQLELAALEASSADEVLEAPQDLAADLTARLAGQTAHLRAAIELDQRAAAKAADRTAEAARDVLRAEMADLEAEKHDLQQRKNRHDRTLTELLAKVAEHDGADYRPHRPDGQAMQQGHGGPWTRSRSEALDAEIKTCQLRIDFLQAKIDGREVPAASNGLPIEHLYSRFVRGPEALPEFR